MPGRAGPGSVPAWAALSPLPSGSEAPGPLAQAAPHPSALLSHRRLPDYFNEDNDSHLGNSNPLTITILISFHYKSETSSLTFKTLAIGSSVESRGWVGAVGGVGKAPGCRWDGEAADGVRDKEPHAEGGTELVPATPLPTRAWEEIGSSPALQGCGQRAAPGAWWHFGGIAELRPLGTVQAGDGTSISQAGTRACPTRGCRTRDHIPGAHPAAPRLS